MRLRSVRGWVAAAGALLACGGCGFKGPLYLPERATVVTHPAQAAQGAQSAGPAQSPAAKSKGKTHPAPGPPQPPPR
jgi:predicted small lipoprotein YifL